jgi:thiamine phosphate synthase YjbQ (UPF0047 family)
MLASMAAWHSHELTIDNGATAVTDVTDEVLAFCRDALRGGGDGLLNVFVPHATAGIALMETGSGSEADLEAAMARLLPRDDRYAHRHGSTGHGADHLLPAIVSPSVRPSEPGSASCWWTSTRTTRGGGCCSGSSRPSRRRSP